MKERRCEACNRFGPVDRSHLLSRGAGARWGSEEYIFLCRWDHHLQHTIGWHKFIEKYPHIEEVIAKKGWHVIEIQNIWKLKRI